MVRLKERAGIWLIQTKIFQFQYGAIEGVTSNHCLNAPYHFNSSMVRLKVVQVRQGCNEVPEFQFQYGAIEGQSCMDAWVERAPFQFQYGAIEGWRYKKLSSLHLNFNSSMVRLKVERRWIDTYQLTNFNSSMVRLKVIRLAVHTEEQIHFNSSMVRLKGSMKSYLSFFTTISIPVWCD